MCEVCEWCINKNILRSEVVFVEVSDNACGDLVSINDIPVHGDISGICPLG